MVVAVSDSLVTYLHDHLAGSKAAVDLLQAMRHGHIKSPGNPFVDSLLTQIEEDRATLQQLVDKISASRPILKEAGAWVFEKTHRLKIDSESEDLGAFQALEFLGLGILGKLSLWRALQTAHALDARLQGFDFERLIDRAKTQHTAVEEQRLKAAISAFAPPAG